jgi:hypothetical protein
VSRFPEESGARRAGGPFAKKGFRIKFQRQRSLSMGRCELATYRDITQQLRQAERDAKRHLAAAQRQIDSLKDQQRRVPRGELDEAVPKEVLQAFKAASRFAKDRSLPLGCSGPVLPLGCNPRPKGACIDP